MSLPEITYDLPTSYAFAKKRKIAHDLINNETVTYDWAHYTKEIVRPADIVPIDDMGPAKLLAEEITEDQVTDDTSECNDSETAKSLDAAAFYDAFVERTPEQCHEELCAPQRSSKWHAARIHCITASNFGAAVGTNPYTSPQDLVYEKIWSSFTGNASTAYGTFHENDARESLLASLYGPLRKTIEQLYIDYFTGCSNGHYVSAHIGRPQLDNFDLIDSGLLKHHEMPWMAVSPDGLLILDGNYGAMSVLIEYKCPASRRDSSEHPYASSPMNVPEYYNDQMQGIMGLLNKFPELIVRAVKLNAVTIGGHYHGTNEGLTVGPPKNAFFVVWQPHQHHVTLVPFDSLDYNARLQPGLQKWYFDFYLPKAVLKHNGALVPNTLIAAPVIHL